MPGVVIKTLTKRYGDVAAVEGLSLDVKPGELVSPPRTLGVRQDDDASTGGGLSPARDR